MSRYVVLKFNEYLIQEGLAEDIAGLVGISDDSSSGQAEPKKSVIGAFAVKGVKVGEKSKEAEEIQKALKDLGAEVTVTGTLTSTDIEKTKAVLHLVNSDSQLKDIVKNIADLDVDDKVITKEVRETLVKLSTDPKAKGLLAGKINSVKPQDYSVEGNNKNDLAFYKKLLKLLDAPESDENLKYLFAWRQAEGAVAANNPFNTTLKLKKDPDMSVYNKVGVKNYSKPEFGLEATYRTLKLVYYKDIVSGLRNDIGAAKIAQSKSLHTWGTGDGVSRVLSAGTWKNPPAIASETTRVNGQKLAA